MPGVKVVEEEKVPETVAVEKSMESMINLDGAMLVFPTSFGYFDPHMLKEAGKFPAIQFRHCGGLWTEGKHPKNTGMFDDLREASLAGLTDIEPTSMSLARPALSRQSGPTSDKGHVRWLTESVGSILRHLAAGLTERFQSNPLHPSGFLTASHP